MNPEHVAVVDQGWRAIAQWRAKHPDEDLDLTGANLTETFLMSADLSGADFSGAILARATLTNANLTRAYIYQADLSGADLGGSGADLSGSGADFSGADLTGAILTRATLTGADFSRTLFGVTRVGDCDLSGCRNLAAVDHRSPSTIGTDTLIRTLRGCGGMFTPEVRAFFLGAGVPEPLLDNLPALVEASPLQFYKCFLSFAAADEPFPTQLYKSLTNAKVSCWKFEESAVLGRGVWANIDRAIRAYDKIIVVCSERSLQRPAVIEEIEKGLDKEDQLMKQGASDTDVLFPVRLDNYVLDGWQHERKGRLLKKVIGDFRGCKPDSAKYRREFGRLMRALDPRSWPLST